MLRQLAAYGLTCAAAALLTPQTGYSQPLTPETIERINRYFEQFTPGFGQSPFQVFSPDLIIESIETRGEATFETRNQINLIVLPFRAIVRNQGNVSAGPSKVSVEYKGNPLSPNITNVVAFSAQGSSNIWYPFTNDILPNSSQVIDGELLFYDYNQAYNVTIRATADSCSGDEFMPNYCRVSEFLAEGNNKSSELPISLPPP